MGAAQHVNLIQLQYNDTFATSKVGLRQKNNIFQSPLGILLSKGRITLAITMR